MPPFRACACACAGTVHRTSPHREPTTSKLMRTACACVCVCVCTCVRRDRVPQFTVFSLVVLSTSFRVQFSRTHGVQLYHSTNGSFFFIPRFTEGNIARSSRGRFHRLSLYVRIVSALSVRYFFSAFCSSFEFRRSPPSPWVVSSCTRGFSIYHFVVLQRRQQQYRCLDLESVENHHSRSLVPSSHRRRHRRRFVVVAAAPGL